MQPTYEGGKECVIVWDVENVRPPLELSAHQIASLISRVFVEAPGRRCAGVFSAVSDAARRAIGPARFDSLATNGVLSWRFLYAPGAAAGSDAAIASGAGGEDDDGGGGSGAAAARGGADDEQPHPFAFAPGELGHDRAAISASPALRIKLFGSDHALKEEILSFSADCSRRGLAPGEGVVVLITSDADFLRPAAWCRQQFGVRVESVYFAPCASRAVAMGGFAQWSCEFRDLLDAFAPLTPTQEQRLRREGGGAGEAGEAASASPFPRRRRAWTFPYPPPVLRSWFERKGWAKLLWDWEHGRVSIQQAQAPAVAAAAKGKGRRLSRGREEDDGADSDDERSSESGGSGSDSDSGSWTSSSSDGGGRESSLDAPERLLRRAERLEAKAAALRRLAATRLQQRERRRQREEREVREQPQQPQRQQVDNNAAPAATTAAAPPPPSSSLIYMALQRRGGGSARGSAGGGGGGGGAGAPAANGNGNNGLPPPLVPSAVVVGPSTRRPSTTASAATNTAPAPTSQAAAAADAEARRRAAVAAAIAAIARDVPAAYARDPDFRRGTPFVAQHGLVRSDEEGMRGWYRGRCLAVPRGSDGGDDDGDDDGIGALRRRVLEICHSTAGHPGPERTASVVGAGWWWPNLEEDAERFVRGECAACAGRERG